jgi:type VI secretion system protein ImpH
VEARASGLDFLQLVRRLEGVHRGRPRLGEAPRAADDPIRLGQAVTLAFRGGAVESYVPGGAGGRPRLAVNFFGLLGPNGPLPLHLSEYAHERELNFGDPTFARFLDVFHHRLLSFFYRAWATAEPTVSRDRPESDRFAGYLASLIGQLLPSVRGTDAFPERAKAFYAGRLATQCRNAEGLAAIISDHFRIPAAVESFVGGWMDLPMEMRWRLGRTPDVAGTLAANTFAGARIWQATQKFRVVLGPLARKDFDRLLPGGEALERLSAIVRFYVGDQLDWDVRLMLDRRGEGRLALGRGSRLGWDSWLGTPGTSSPDSDVIFAPTQEGPAASTGR